MRSSAPHTSSLLMHKAPRKKGKKRGKTYHVDQIPARDPPPFRALDPSVLVLAERIHDLPGRVARAEQTGVEIRDGLRGAAAL